MSINEFQQSKQQCIQNKLQRPDILKNSHQKPKNGYLVIIRQLFKMDYERQWYWKTVTRMSFSWTKKQVLFLELSQNTFLWFTVQSVRKSCTRDPIFSPTAL